MPGLEPRTTEPESVVLPITPHPISVTEEAAEAVTEAATRAAAETDAEATRERAEL